MIPMSLARLAEVVGGTLHDCPDPSALITGTLKASALAYLAVPARQATSTVVDAVTDLAGLPPQAAISRKAARRGVPRSAMGCRR